MIVKFHARGTGKGSGPVDYLLGRERNREGAALLRGNPDQTESLIDSSRFAKRYTSGVLSFAEADLPPEAKNALMDDFEASLLPGLDADQYECL
ncbi:nuclease, partial [Klebsiella pneumoniae]|nr:nuclease [Klebsiella pneumoniae]